MLNIAVQCAIHTSLLRSDNHNLYTYSCSEPSLPGISHYNNGLVQTQYLAADGLYSATM